MKKQINKHNGIIYEKFISSEKSDGVCAINNERIVLNGTPKMTICKNQYKFGDQLEVSVIAPKGTIIKKEKRNNSNWDVITIYFSLEEGRKIIEELNKKLNKKEGEE